MRRHLFPIIVVFASCFALHADGVGRIVRIPTPAKARCINAKADEITMTLRSVKTQKTKGFVTDDNRAGVTVIATLNSDGHPKAQNPSVNLVGVKDAPAGQVFLPLEYPVASLLPLSQDSGATFTKNIVLELYLDKVRKANSFGDILDVAGSLLPKLPIPANPYTNAVSQIVNYATSAITKASADNGGLLFASVTLVFDDRDQPDVSDCKNDGFETTGAIAVVAATGQHDATLLPLDKLESDYCWRYVADNTSEVQYAPKLSRSCNRVSDTEFKDVPNDYVMILLSAQKTLPPARVQEMFAGDLERGPGATLFRERERDLKQSRALCDAMKQNWVYCGAP
jgi:hypothetical protein